MCIAAFWWCKDMLILAVLDSGNNCRIEKDTITRLTILYCCTYKMADLTHYTD